VYHEISTYGPISADSRLALALMLGCDFTVAVLERARRLIQELLLPGINLVGMNLIALGQIGYWADPL
jgi:hypothetical protein